MERIYDLLNPATVVGGQLGRGEEKGELKMRWSSAQGRFYVENLFEYECNSVNDVLEHYARGAQHKAMAATTMNAASSRSHAVFQITLTRRTESNGDGAAGSSLSSGAAQQLVTVREVVSSFVLADLAGSERASASSESGSRVGADRFKEAVNINQSLFALRRVVTALSSKSQGRDDLEHVPYRDAKLTSLLQHVIGGNAFMLMLACLSPADQHFEENMSTLQYASQAALIKAEPLVNLDPKDRLIQNLQQQLRLAQEMLKAAHEYILTRLDLDELPAELTASAILQTADIKLGSFSQSFRKQMSSSMRSTSRDDRVQPRKTSFSTGDMNLKPERKLDAHADQNCTSPHSESVALPPSGIVSPRPPQPSRTTPPLPPMIGKSSRDSPSRRQRQTSATLRGSRSEQHLPPVAPSRGELPAIKPPRPESADAPAKSRAQVRGSSVPAKLNGSGSLPSLPLIGPQPAAPVDATAEGTSTSSRTRSASVKKIKPRRPLPPEQQMLREIQILRQKQALVAAQREMQARLQEANNMMLNSRHVSSHGSIVQSAVSRTRRPHEAAAPKDETRQTFDTVPQAGPGSRFDWVQNRCFELRSRFDHLAPDEVQELEDLLDEFTTMLASGNGAEQPASESVEHVTRQPEEEVASMENDVETQGLQPTSGEPQREAALSPEKAVSAMPHEHESERFQWVQNRCFELRDRFDQLSPHEVQELEDLLDELSHAVGKRTEAGEHLHDETSLQDNDLPRVESGEGEQEMSHNLQSDATFRSQPDGAAQQCHELRDQVEETSLQSPSRENCDAKGAHDELSQPVKHEDTAGPACDHPQRFQWVEERCFELRDRFDQLSPQEVTELEDLLDEFASLVAKGNNVERTSAVEDNMQGSKTAPVETPPVEENETEVSNSSASIVVTEKVENQTSGQQEISDTQTYSARPAEESIATEPDRSDPHRFHWVQSRCCEMRDRFDQLTPSEMQELEDLLDELGSLFNGGDESSLAPSNDVNFKENHEPHHEHRATVEMQVNEQLDAQVHGEGLEPSSSSVHIEGEPSLNDPERLEWVQNRCLALRNRLDDLEPAELEELECLLDEFTNSAAIG
eukprot:TRINITY_DN2035_c0_g5_i1.p1 TRINITY_DN2035_c0_g5~~TRINITY_DN2035_c0_g5_i1.p1  ORF type:complete len:1088 (-),score=139.02 TRINITY_DN2035_c0_g5_i1:466-3729(-)